MGGILDLVLFIVFSFVWENERFFDTFGEFWGLMFSFLVVFSVLKLSKVEKGSWLEHSPKWVGLGAL